MNLENQYLLFLNYFTHKQNSINYIRSTREKGEPVSYKAGIIHFTK